MPPEQPRHRAGEDSRPGVKGGGLAAAAKRKPTVVLFGGAAAVVAVFALLRRKGGAGASSDSSGTAGGQAQLGAYDSTANDVYNSIESQLEALQQQIGAISTAQGATGGTTKPPATGGGSKPPTKKPPTKKPPGGPVKTKKPIPKKPKPRPKPTLQEYTIKRNDTLYGIASAHNEKLSTLLADNPTFRTNPKYRGGNRIFAGGHVKVR